MANEDRSKRERARRVYSTALINKLIDDRNQGYDIDFDPFFNRDTELRASNIPFKMTEEELEEYQKCYDDPEYFINKYCKFMTDKGLSTVDLREYQRKVIDIVTAESYDEELDDAVPTNRNIVWLASRQVGKCVGFNELATFSSSNTLSVNKKIGQVFHEHFELTMFSKCLYRLYGWVKNRKVKNVVGKLIEKIEHWGFKNCSFDENDNNKKIVKTVDVDDLSVLTDTGYHKVTHLHLTQPYTVYDIEFADGTHIECADNHILYKPTHNDKTKVYVKALRPGEQVVSKGGTKIVKSIYKCPYKLMMYDLTVDSPDHTYYASDVLSHNTTTTSAFMAWMIVFHVDRNILIVANKEKTAIEIVDKITNIFKGLPFFLKPGCESFGKTGLKLDNGSKIISSATTNTASIGFTIHCVYLDEFAHIPDNIVNNFWRSVYPTLSSSKVSQCIITSTPNGTTNKFYEIWSKSLEGENSFVNVRTDYWEVPGHDDEWAKKQIADFGEEEFAQEFALQFNKNSKMILKSHTMSYISRMVTNFIPKQIISQNQYLAVDNLTWHPDFDPNNISPRDKFIFIVDLAEGGADPDEAFKSKKKGPDSNTVQIFKLRLNSVANVRRYSEISCGIQDCIRFEQVGKFTTDVDDEIYTARVCSALAYNLFKDHENNNVRIMVEMNFNGKSFYEEFKRHVQFTGSTILKTYHRKPVPGEKQKKKPGFKTTQNKEYYCLKGNKLLDMRRIIVRDKETFDQMKSFGYVRGKLKGIACHDDLSMPVFNHIPRMLDEKTFIGWIEEYLVFGATDPSHVYRLNMLIQKWAQDNPEMTQEQFEMLYGLNETPSISMYNESGIGMSGSVLGSSYGMMGVGQYQQNPYSGMSLGTYGTWHR